MADLIEAWRARPAIRPQKAGPMPKALVPEAVTARVITAAKRVPGWAIAPVKAPVRGPARARATSRVIRPWGRACRPVMMTGLRRPRAIQTPA